MKTFSTLKSSLSVYVENVAWAFLLLLGEIYWAGMPWMVATLLLVCFISSNLYFETKYYLLTEEGSLKLINYWGVARTTYYRPAKLYWAIHKKAVRIVAEKGNENHWLFLREPELLVKALCQLYPNLKVEQWD